MADIVRKKVYTLNYPTDILNTIAKLSFSKGRAVDIIGSQSLKSQQYAGDFDMDEVVKVNKPRAAALKELATRFKEIIRTLLATKDLYIGDIKAGEIPQWRVLPEDAYVKNDKVLGYSAADCRRKLSSIKSLLSDKEFGEASALLKDKPTPKQFFEAADALKFHVVRWKPSDVLRGYIVLRDGRHYTLEEAFSTPAIVKLDVVAYIQRNRFADFSILFTFEDEKNTLNRVAIDFERELQQSYLSYISAGNYFKAAKRLFSIARQKEDKPKIEAYNTMFNSDLGRLYSIISDAKTILYLLENEPNMPLEKIQYEIDQFRGRLGNVYSIGAVGTDNILKRILAMSELPSTSEGRKTLRNQMEALVEVFENALSSATLAYLRQHKLLSVP
jgi:hypothetical protein